MVEVAPEMTLLTLPTRRDEAWRYSDLDALAEAWPLNPPETIRVAAGEEIARVVVQDSPPDSVAIKDIAIVLEKGARATFHGVHALRHSVERGRGKNVA